MASTKVFGKVDLRWQSNALVLPVEKAAQFLQLYAEGVHRQNGSWEKPGLSKHDRDGEALSLPSIEVISDAKLDELLLRGHQNDDEDRAKRAAEADAERLKAAEADSTRSLASAQSGHDAVADYKAGKDLGVR